MSQHYEGEHGERYFEVRARRRDAWIQAIGAQFLTRFVSPDATVLDFGCGTGAMLLQIPCGRRIGIEVNGPSREEARARGLDVFTSTEPVHDRSVDVVLSHHSLEHVLEPAAILREFNRVLREGGALVVVVPAESPHRSGRTWREEPDKHLFSWTPLTLGNLVTECGFLVEQAFLREFGYSRYLLPIAGVPLLYPASRKVLAHLTDRYHTVCVARRR